MRRIIGLALSLSLFPAWGSPKTITHHIQGNPISRRDDYTLNSVQARQATIQCVFTHRGAKKADLNIWTAPTQTKPFTTLHLNTASISKPYTIKRKFSLPLNNEWWCRIYIPRPKRRWKYCAYFSISDATIAETNPFSTWNKTIHSKDTHYTCKILKASKGLSFYYFKANSSVTQKN